MNRAPKSWLLPTAVVSYIALGTFGPESTWLGAWVLLAPIGLALGLRQLPKWAEAGQVHTSTPGLRVALIGLAMYLAAVPAQPDQSGLRAAMCLGLGLLVSATLFCIARQASPPGLLQGHPAAQSLDAVFVASALWSLAFVAFAARVLAPEHVSLDPWALDTASLFASMGGLLLMTASLLRVRLLRGLELGVGDKATAGLSLAIAGTAVAAGSGFLTLGTADRVAGMAACATAVGTALSVAAPSAPHVTRAVRGLLALLLLGAPTALVGAWLAQENPQHAATATLVTAGFCAIIGLVAKVAARPLAPAGSRWLNALSRAMDAALQPEPDLALRAALSELRKAEPRARARPEVFRFEPPAVFSVDIAGYLEERVADFPEAVLSTALGEPSHTLRRETLQTAQVRKPKVRPLMTWFEAHDSKTATALCDDAGPVGLLILPRGSRRSVLSMEETRLLQRLSQRLAGLVAVSAALRRSRDREQGYRQQAEAAKAAAAMMEERLTLQKRNDLAEARAQVEILRASAHSPGAQIKLQEIESQALEPVLRLVVPPGVDALPWAAHAHLIRNPDPKPLVVVDLAQHAAQAEDFWLSFAGGDQAPESAPLKRAQEGTLVLLHPGALPEEYQMRLATILASQLPAQLTACLSPRAQLSAILNSLLRGPEVVLPTWEERPEDLQAFVLAELSRLGLMLHGKPLGIERAALHALVQRELGGNDAELRGLLSAAAARATGQRLTLMDLLYAMSGSREDLEPPPGSAPAEELSTLPKRRTRMRPPPRARRL